MIDYALFYNSQDNDRVYDADSFSDWLKKFFTTGVFEGDLQVQASEGMKITVGKGYANIEGKVMIWKKSTTLDITTANATFDRIDTVVVERNDSERNFFLKVVTGGASATPEPIAPVRGGGVYQIILAEIHVKAGATAISQADITDKRANADVCGIVAGAVKQIDFSQIQAQYDAYMRERKKQVDADYTAYKEKVDRKETESANALKKHLATMEANEGLQEQAFSTWFNSVKNQLGTDQAGHLQNQLDALKERHDKDIDSVTKKLITLTVTTDDDELIGDIVKVTKGVTALEQTFDASKSLVFHLPELGKWKVTNANPDHSGSSEVTCEMYGRYSVALLGDFNWKKLVTAGGLSADGYTSLADVLADEKAVRQLMTKHASADILAKAVIKNDQGFRAKITASKNAMKWIGLRDYICDKLLADAETQSNLLASDHWRYILKDSVPYMTSSTSPYGEVETTASAMAPYYAYKVFSALPNQNRDSWAAAPVGEYRIGYRFTNPICIKRVATVNRVEGGTANRCIKDFTVIASNDGKTWDKLGQFTGKNYEGTEAHTDHFDLKNDKYYLHYALRILSSHDATHVGIGRLNFYGRSLNISVPAMTSDSAPWGKVIYSSQWDGGSSAARQAFSEADSPWYPSPSDSSGKAYIGYVYPTPTRVRQVSFICHNGNQNEVCVVERSDDGERWEKASDEIQITVDNETKIQTVDAPPARYWRIRNVSGNIYVANQGGFNLKKIQFYGVDYSEGDERAYIYDHGIEVLPITTIGAKNPDAITLSAVSGAKATTDVTSAKRLRASVGANASGSVRLVCGSAFKAITSTDMPASSYLDISSVNGSADVGIDMTSAGTFDLAEMWME